MCLCLVGESCIVNFVFLYVLIEAFFLCQPRMVNERNLSFRYSHSLISINRGLLSTIQSIYFHNREIIACY